MVRGRVRRKNKKEDVKVEEENITKNKSCKNKKNSLILIKDEKFKSVISKKNKTPVRFNDLLNEKNFIEYIENLQIKTYKDKIFQKNDSVKFN